MLPRDLPPTTLPVDPASDGAPDRPKRQRVRRVLVVDDDADCAETTGMLVEMLGHRVTVANSGPAALDVLRTFLPDLVLLDLGMPGMDGYEVARRARQMPEGQTVTLVALTGWGGERQGTRDAGFDHHLLKPTAVEALEALLNAPSRRSDASY